METHSNFTQNTAAPLCIVPLDNTKIWRSVGLRFLIVAVACVLMKDQFDSLPLTLVLFAIYAGVTLFPLVHRKDQLEYYPRQIRYKGVFIPLPAPDQIRFVNEEDLFTTKYLELGKQRLNITYLKDARDLFLQTYCDDND